MPAKCTFGTPYVVPPVRPGAAPQIDLNAARVGADATVQPAWVRMTPALVGWLRYHFSSATNIEFPALQNRVWTAQPSSPIFISSLAEWSPTQASQRPCVLVDRLDQEVDLEKRPIGNQLQGIKQGNFSQVMRGRHVVHCLGGAEGEADLLACEVWRELARFQHYVARRICLLRLQVDKVGKRMQISKENKEHYTVPIELSYGYLEAWRCRPLDEAEIAAINVELTGA